MQEAGRRKACEIVRVRVAFAAASDYKHSSCSFRPADLHSLAEDGGRE
jgi:hypothetical protein